MKAIIDQFIGVYDNVVAPELCELLIKDFELNYEMQLAFNRKRAQVKPGMLIDDDAIDYNSPEENWIFSDGSNVMHLVHAVGQCYEHYKCEMGGFIGMQPAHFNAVKVQRTTPGQGYHVWHCEQAARETAHKFMFYIAYLNDVEEGGETEFLYQSIRVAPRKGRVLLAPACYTHMHRGNQPLQGSKYVATGWLEW
jgi:hypothetical protein